MFSVIGEIFQITGIVLFQILKATWWIIFPIFLFGRVEPLWLLQQRIRYSKVLDWVLLEIFLPTEVIKTPKAMENVFTGLHGAWSPITWRKKWLEGTMVDQFSLELVGFHGELHFYIRCLQKNRHLVESKIFSQYPDAEIHEVGDYVDDLPPETPSVDYEMWGADFTLAKHWAFPIETYPAFEDLEEERRLDPLSQFAELVSKMERNEYLVLQIIISPVVTEIEGQAQKIRDELAKRKAPVKKTATMAAVDLLGDVGRVLAGSEIPIQAEVPKMEELGDIRRLTPGEVDTLKSVEIKARQHAFFTTVRASYIARKDVWHGEHIAGLSGFFKQFSGFNNFRPQKKTYPRNSLLFFPRQRNYMRKRKNFMAYRSRFLGFLSPPIVLSTEELATLFHFPGKVVRAPLMPRISTRTAEPPRGLPM